MVTSPAIPFFLYRTVESIEWSICYKVLRISRSNRGVNIERLLHVNLLVYRKSKYVSFSSILLKVTFLLNYCCFLFLKVRVMKQLFCDCCGEIVKAVYPCKFIYHDNLICDFNICLDCMTDGTLKIDLKRKRKVSQILLKLSTANSEINNRVY